MLASIIPLILLLLISCLPPRELNNKFSSYFVRIDQPSSITPRNKSSYLIRGLCNEIGIVVLVELEDINQMTVTPEVPPICSGGGNWETTIDTRNLVDGIITIRISQTDSSKVTHRDTIEVNKDITPLLMTLDAKNILNDMVENYELSGTCSEWGRPITIQLIDENDAKLIPENPIICTEGRWSFSTNTKDLLDGTITINAIHRDASEKPYYVDIAIKKDTTLPTVSINQPSSILNLSERNYQMSGSCSENQSLIEIKLYEEDNPSSYDVNASSRCINGNWADSLNPSRLQDGQIVLVVTHRDQAGNSSHQETVISKDVLKPNISITRANNIFPSTASSYSLSGSCSENQREISIKFLDSDNITTDLSTTSPCADQSWALDNFNISSLVEGSVTITISQTDVMGNHREVSTQVEKSNSSLVVTIDNIPHVSISNRNNYPLTGTCSPSGGILTLKIGGIPPLGQPQCTNKTWSATFNLELILDSPTVDVTADYTDRDEIESAPQFSTSIIKDTIAPSVSLNAPMDINRISDSSYSLSGECSDHGESISIEIDTLSFQDNCINSSWSYMADVSSLASGMFTITVTHTDGVGNFSRVNKKTNRDNSIILTLNEPQIITDTNESSYSISGACSEVNSEVTVNFASITPSSQPICATNFTWEVNNLDVSLLADGSLSISITHSGTTITGNVHKGCLSLSGTGIQTNPFVICNYTDLKSINNNRAKYYILGQDIDARASWSEHENNTTCVAFDGTTVDSTSPCSGMSPIGIFTGELDGNGHEISNIYMSTSLEELALLIEISQNAVVKNIHLKNIMIVNNMDTTSNPSTGGLVGSADSLTTISNCSVTGIIKGEGNSGGIAGYSNGTLNNSYTDVTVEGVNAGGLIGYSNAGITSNSHSKGIVKSLVLTSSSFTSTSGGLVGYMSDSTFIQNSLSNVTLSGGTYQGGLVGTILNSGVKNSYSLSSLTSGTSSTDGGLIGSSTMLSGLSINLFWETYPMNTLTHSVGSDSTAFSSSGLTIANMQLACPNGAIQAICSLGAGFSFSAGEAPAIKKCLDCSLNNPTYSSELVLGQ